MELEKKSRGRTVDGGGDTQRFQGYYQSEAEMYHFRRYSTRYGRLFKELHEAALSILLSPLAKNARVLEVACGTGHTTVQLLERDYDLTAVDLTMPMMAQARQTTLTAMRKAEFLRADAKALPFPSSTFDAVVSTRFLHLFPINEQSQLVAEAVRVLKPNGIVVNDSDNWVSRWLLCVPHLIYNLVRYRRLAPYSVYNRESSTIRHIPDLVQKGSSVS